MGKVTSQRNHDFDMVGDSSRGFNILSEPASPSSFLRSEKYESTDTLIGSRTQPQDPHRDEDDDLNRGGPQSSLVNEKFRFPVVEAINRGCAVATNSCLNSNESTVNKVFRTNVTSRKQTEEKQINRDAAAAACARRVDRDGIGIVLRKIPTASSSSRPTREDTNGPRTTEFSSTSATTGTLEFADQNGSNNKNIIPQKIAKHDMQHETGTTRSMPPIMMSPISAATTYTSPTPGLSTMGSDLSASSETVPSVSLSSVPLSPSGVVPDAFNSSTCDSRTCSTAPTTRTTPAMQAPFSGPIPNAAEADRCQDPGGADLEGGRDGGSGSGMGGSDGHTHAHSLDFEDEMGPSAVVHDAARVLDWSRVMELCGESPLDAGYRGTDGWFALHFACNRRPPSDVVESLVRAHPDAVFMRDTNKGMTPLHYACRFKASREVVRLLLRAAAESSSSSAGAGVGQVLSEARRVENACRLKCKLGRTPLYYATRYDAPEGVMQMLLEAYPTGAIDEDRKGETPLRLVWDKYATTLAGKRSISDFFQRVGVVSKSLGHEPTSASPPNFKGKTAQPIVASTDPAFNYREASRRLHLLKKDAKLFAKFQAADMLLRAAHHGCRQRSQDTSKDGNHGGGEAEPFQPNANQFRFVLHAIANVGCHVHPTLWELARCVFPQQLALPDDRARMPLHYAVACTACGHSDHSWLCPMSRSAAGARRGAARTPPSSSAPSSVAASPGMAAVGGGGGGLVNAAVERPVLTPSASSASVVASASTSSASEEILHELLELYPKAASCRDGDGRSPLTLAMENTCHDFAWYASPGSEPSESAMAATNVEETDLDTYAALVPTSASTRGPEDGILRKLLMASPTVLYSPDPRTRLYPFMMAAADARSRHAVLKGSSGGGSLTAGDDTEAEKLTMVYELIRMLPERMHDALR